MVCVELTSWVVVVVVGCVNSQSALMHWLCVEVEDVTVPELVVAVTAAELAGRKERLFLCCIRAQQLGSLMCALKTQTQTPEDP